MESTQHTIWHIESAQLMATIMTSMIAMSYLRAYFNVVTSVIFEFQITQNIFGCEKQKTKLKKNGLKITKMYKFK